MSVFINSLQLYFYLYFKKFFVVKKIARLSFQLNYIKKLVKLIIKNYILFLLMKIFKYLFVTIKIF